jgi:hypothetical protein
MPAWGSVAGRAVETGIGTGGSRAGDSERPEFDDVGTLNRDTANNVLGIFRSDWPVVAEWRQYTRLSSRQTRIST